MAESWAGKLLRIVTLVTTCSIWSVEAASRRVYYSCGAIVDSDARGIVLSPGFPTSYVPGTHCVWQFFIPAGVRLVLEVFDFDVFENPRNDKTLLLRDQSAPAVVGREKSISGSLENGSTVQSRVSNDLYSHTEESRQDGRIKVSFNETNVSKAFDVDYQGFPVTQSEKAEDKQVVAQEESAQLEVVKVSPLMPDFSVTDSPLDVLDKDDSTKSNSSDFLVGDYKDIKVGPQYNSERQGENRLENDHLEVQEVNDSTEATLISATKVTPFASPEVCPNDVLYISDLITFSARFCGANSPVNKTLMFGSSLEMVEVVVELITTTDRGRGFLLLYQFKNGVDADLRTLMKHRDQDNLIHFLVIAGVAFLSAILLTALCRTWRKRAHCKGCHSHCSRRHENGIQNSAIDVGELQLVANRTSQEESTENENNNHSISLGRMGNSLQAGMELASTESAVTESGSDEIFVISTGPSLGTLQFTSFKTKTPKRSPPAVCECLMTEDRPGPEGEKPLQTLAVGSGGGGDSPSRQRAWSTRTFHDVLGPLPQLPREWRGWTTTDPFTKLVENCGTTNLPGDHHTEINRKVMSDMQLEAESEQLYSDSSGSAASYPLTQSAQSQRKVISATNLRRAWFGSPCFGFRPGSPQHSSSGHNHIKQPTPQYGPRGLGPWPSAGSPVSNNINRSFQTDATKTRHLANESDRINVTKPVFVISEASDDRQPLVQALEHAGQYSHLSHFEEIRPDEGNQASDRQELEHPVNGSS
ncbi:uncharacterized protein si:dkey-112e17.1 [Heptranchias perlo]|uniref:uncharacterized protein si:dkey-112e17.1 n=1 Tax=Heptranchias perlo TaxID=212740 RepID=UPI00355AB3AA